MGCFQCISMGHILNIKIPQQKVMLRYFRFGICRKSLFVDVFLFLNFDPLKYIENSPLGAEIQ